LPKNASIERQVITILWKREERREKREERREKREERREKREEREKRPVKARDQSLTGQKFNALLTSLG